MIGIQDHDEIQEIRAFFASHSESEQRRLLHLFSVLVTEDFQPYRDLSDKSPDGTRKAMPGVSAATNGR